MSVADDGSYLVPAVTIVSFLGAFHLYLGSRYFLCFYVPLRLIERFSWQPLADRCATSALLAAAALLGVGLGAIVGMTAFSRS